MKTADGLVALRTTNQAVLVLGIFLVFPQAAVEDGGRAVTAAHADGRELYDLVGDRHQIAHLVERLTQMGRREAHDGELLAVRLDDPLRDRGRERAESLQDDAPGPRLRTSLHA